MTKLGSGEGVEQLNIILALTRAVYRNAKKKQLRIFVQVWIYEVLDLPDCMNHIAAGLFILVKETNFSNKGLKNCLKNVRRNLKQFHKMKQRDWQNIIGQCVGWVDEVTKVSYRRNIFDYNYYY